MPISSSKIAAARARIRKRGKAGETAAAHWLEQNGYDVLCRNYHNSRQEIDIVARRDGILHFIEVKTRRYREGVVPATAVDRQKKRNIISAAWGYLREIGHPPVKYQFDIIEVLMTDDRLYSINYLEDMFSDYWARKRLRK